MLTLGVSALDGIHRGQTVTIVGKGPSLAHLSPSDIGSGPVIAINDAIMAVEQVAPPTTVYSLQKDGCLGFDGPSCGECGGCRVPQAPIADTTVYLAQVPRSSRCFPGHPMRYEFAPEDVGMPHGGGMSVVIAIRLAVRMGASALRLVSLDSCTHGIVTANYSPLGWDDVAEHASGEHYAWARTVTLEAVEQSGLLCEWVTPSPRGMIASGKRRAKRSMTWA